MTIPFESIKSFYEANLPGAAWKGSQLVAPCPLCTSRRMEPPGRLAVLLNPESFFRGYFQCSSSCVPGGYHFHFGRLLGMPGDKVPGFDPDAQTHGTAISWPARDLGPEVEKNAGLMGQEQFEYFARMGISAKTLQQMRVGYNGRYLFFPYFQENGYAYAARCLMPGNEQDFFWHGDEAFGSGAAAMYNVRDIAHAEGGALFITEGEVNLLILKELGYPAVSLASPQALAGLDAESFGRVEHLFVLLANTPEARQTARDFAVRIGFKTRILAWPEHFKPGARLADAAADPSERKKTVQRMIQQARPFSPFERPEKECRRFQAFLDQEKGRSWLGLETGFAKLDRHLEGLRGISILGGPPKAGKSCFFMQISTEVARRKVPVIYYDFENGRHKIYLRTLVRWSQLTEKQIRSGQLSSAETQALQAAREELERLLVFFRVVQDRQLTPDIMRRHIEFLRHETRRQDLLIIIDSLHKLPFRDLTERRTGIDWWLRQLEAIRDQQQVCFLMVSELTRGKGGGYGEKPDLTSFKESGDIEYSADNALILMPGWDPMAPAADQPRRSSLWVVASREASPGPVADYVLDFPWWRFKEM